MADSQKAENAEEQAQPESMPDSEEKGTETNQSQEAAGESQETSEAPAGDSEELELPEGVKERTSEQFEKLKEQLREYRDELFQIKNQVTPKKEEVEKPLYDPKTGLVDLEALEQVRKDAREARKELENLRRLDSDREVQGLYDTYPELKNPKTQKDKEFFDESEKIWLHSQANPEKYGGKALSQKQAADLAKKRMTQPKVNSDTEAKQQASAEASGKPSQGVARQSSEEDLQQLRFGTRTGDKDSIIARMRMIRESRQAS